MANPWDPVPQAPDDSPPTYYSNAPAPTTQPPKPPQGGYWTTGYGGASPGGGGGSVTLPGGFPPGSPGWEALAGQQGRIDRNFGQAAALLGKNFAGSTFGQGLQGMWSNPQGWDPRALEMQRTMLAENEAGSRENALRQLEGRATAGGFGDSMGLNDALSRTRTTSAGNLQRGYNDLFMAEQDRKNANRFQAAQLLMNLYGMDAQQAQRLAELYANKQETAIPGMKNGQPGTGTQGAQPVGGGWWNQQGQYQQQPRPYDPYYQGGGPGTGQGVGYTPQTPWKPW